MSHAPILFLYRKMLGFIVEYKVLVNFLAGQNSLAEKIPIKSETFFSLARRERFYGLVPQNKRVLDLPLLHLYYESIIHSSLYNTALKPDAIELFHV